MRYALLLCIVGAVGACGGSTSPEGGSGSAAQSLFIHSVLADGVVDVASTTTYAPAIVVGNIAEGDGARCAITGFDVTVTDVNGTMIGTFHSDAAGFVEGAHAGTPSYARFTATLLDDATVARMRVSGTEPQRLLARASVTGKSMAGTVMKSLPFDFPFELCAGCLPPNVGPTR